MLSVYSRHYPPCPSDDINYKRCRCPKWINGILGSDGPFIRRSAKTRSWEKTEDFKRKLEEEDEAKQHGLQEASRPKPALVTVKEAVSRFLNSKRNENLADSTLDKLTTIFEKQSLAWAPSYGFVPPWKAFVTLGAMAPREEKETGAVDRLLLVQPATRLDISPIPLFCWVESEQMVLRRITSLRPSSPRSWTQPTSISPKAGWNAGTEQHGCGF